jgi:epsin
MLRQFHYIDQNGKDQGVNVRNRAQELAKLLQDVDAIRSERKKARANRTKFGGVEGGVGMSGGFSSNNRYGGFGSDEAGFGGYQGEVYGDGGGFGGNQSGFSDTQRRGDRFEEYDEGDDAAPSSKTAVRTRKDSTTRAGTGGKRESQKQKAKEPEQDLFDFGDEPAPTSSSNGKVPAQASSVLDDFGAVESGATADDDFDDFQSATSPAVPTASQPSVFASLSPPPATTSTTTSATQFAAPKPLAASQASNFKDLFSTTSPAPSATSSTGAAAPSTLPSYSSPSPQPASQPFRPNGPNYFTSVPVSINTPPVTSPSSAFSSQTGFPSQKQPSYSSPTSMASLGKPAAKPTTTAGGGDAFGSLWSTATAKAGVQVKTTTASKGPDLASMAKAKSEAGIWGPSASSGMRPGATTPTPNAVSGQARPTVGLGNGLDDLLG